MNAKRISWNVVAAGVVASGALLVQGCGDDAARQGDMPRAAAQHEGAAGAVVGHDSVSVADHARMFQGLSVAIAVLQPTAGNAVQGTVTFEDQGDSVQVTTDITGLPPNREFGFHVHQWGDVSASDGTSAGDHYNPEGHPHALPPNTPRHAGDLGNLRSDANGVAKTTISVGNITVVGLENPILGRAVVVHEQPDDGSQPTGAAGNRIAVGVIGVAQAAGASAGAAATGDTTRAAGRAAGS